MSCRVSGRNRHTQSLILDAWSFQTWIFDPPSNPAEFSSASLLESFRQAISIHAFWGGQLHWTSYDPSKGYQHRSGRLALKYGGSPSDYPGFSINFASTTTTLSEILPSTQPDVWAIDETFPSTALIPDEEVALQDSFTLEGLPNIAVRVTRFGCGGVGLGIKMTHSLADATSLVGFMKIWSDFHANSINPDNERGLASKPTPTVIFDPSLLDSHASGDLSSPSGPNPALLDISRSLPLHRYDWLVSGGEGCPPWAERITQYPAEVKLDSESGSSHEHNRERGERMPWGEWDMSLPVRHTVLRFSADEVERIWENARSSEELATEEHNPRLRLSRLDTMLAHIWKAVMKANGILPTETAYLDLTFGFRTRLSLPSNYLGSPLRQTSITGNPSLPISTLSRSIRTNLNSIGEPGACEALLHDLAYDTTGQNIWATFLGRRHLLCTSWTRLGVYEIDFGSSAAVTGTTGATRVPSGRPRWVNAYMPASDGLVQVMEASAVLAGAESSRQRTGAKDLGSGDHWWKNGVSVSLHLAEPTMERLLGDPGLREL